MRYSLCALLLLMLANEANTAPVPQSRKLSIQLLVGEWNCTFGRWEGIAVFTKSGNYQMYPLPKNGEAAQIHVFGQFWIDGDVITFSRVRVSHALGEHIDEGVFSVAFDTTQYPKLVGVSEDKIKVVLSNRRTK